MNVRNILLTSRKFRTRFMGKYHRNKEENGNFIRLYCKRTKFRYTIFTINKKKKCVTGSK